jgi:hypothetical protein
MPFIVQKECPCCRGYMIHCRSCWDAFHHPKTQKDEDYVPPKYHGQSMISDELRKSLITNKIEYTSRVTIKEDRARPYVEGEYHH